MTSEGQGSKADLKMRRQVRSVLLMLLFVGVVVAAFVTAAPWLRDTIGAPMVGLISVALCIIVFATSEIFGIRYNRDLDEVQLESQRFATRWGATAGQIAFILLLIAPPFQDFATGVVNQFTGYTGVDDRIIVLAMVFGFGSLVLLQTLGTFIFGFVWWKRSLQ